MGCDLFEKYLKANDCYESNISEEMLKHLNKCKDCRNYYQFVSVLNSQKDLLEKAPEEILLNVEKRIFNNNQIKHKEPFIFAYLLKPTFAGFFMVLLCLITYTYLGNKSVGCVENLSERFKLAQFQNIKSGDMLYAGDNTTAAISLKSKNKVQIHKNTVIKVNDSRNLTLPRGAISLQAGDKELQIATPDGLFRAMNTTARIHTVTRLENGVIKTETTCMVFKGQLSIKSSLQERVLEQGQKAIFAKNGRISNRQQLTVAEVASEQDIAVKHTIFTAVTSICDCVYSFYLDSEKKADHLKIFGKEVNENKFKVRVFWQAGGLNGLVTGPSSKNDDICYVKKRRIRV